MYLAVGDVGQTLDSRLCATQHNNSKVELKNLWQSFSAQRAGNPADLVSSQIFKRLGLRASHEDDANSSH